MPKKPVKKKIPPQTSDTPLTPARKNSVSFKKQKTIPLKQNISTLIRKNVSKKISFHKQPSKLSLSIKSEKKVSSNKEKILRSKYCLSDILDNSVEHVESNHSEHISEEEVFKEQEETKEWKH